MTIKERPGKIKIVGNAAHVDLRYSTKTVKNAYESLNRREEKRLTESIKVLLYHSLRNRQALMTTYKKNEIHA